MNLKNLRNYDLNLLVLFEVLMKEKSVSKAAEKVFLSQSAMSHALKRLRNLLNDKILIKTDYGMIPTPLASKLIDPISDALDHIKQTIQEIGVFDPATSNEEFVITCTEYFESLFFPYLMKQFQDNCPNISVIPDIFGQTMPVELLTKGQVDFVVGIHYLPAPPKGLKSIPWIKDSLVCIVRRDNAIVGDRLTIKQFSEVPQLYYILFEAPYTFTFADLWVQENNCEVYYKSGASVYLTAARTITNTNYIMALPRKIAEMLLKYEDLRIVELPGKIPEIQLDLFWHKMYENEPAHQWMKEQLINLPDLDIC
ncbi:MAG: LysR family transcriptional regulator [Desulfobacterales bacterium]|nr:LysR family transcriptional regulator [Desulfobacterales bacterium]